MTSEEGSSKDPFIDAGRGRGGKKNPPLEKEGGGKESNRVEHPIVGFRSGLSRPEKAHERIDSQSLVSRDSAEDKPT